MKKTFIFFRTSFNDVDVEDLPPVYARTLSEIEDYLTSAGVEILNLWKEELEEKTLYRGKLMGAEYEYGFMVDDDILLFLFTMPEALKKLDDLPLSVREKTLSRLWRGYVRREFLPQLGGVQFTELVNRMFYVAVEW